MTRAERRTQIVQVVLSTVARYGVQGATIQRIASGAGISQGLLYKHFQTKEELLWAATDQILDMADAVVARADGDDAIARIRAIHSLSSSLTLSAKLNVGYQHAFLALVISATEPRLREHIKTRQVAIVKAIAEIVESAKAQGAIAPETDAEDLAWQLLGVNWAEDVTHIMGFDDFVTLGRSARMIETLLQRHGAQSY
jgi:AcrR family transcriptional regulator